MNLASKNCVPCRRGVPPLAGAPLTALHEQLAEGWEVVDGHHLAKAFRLKDFVSALAFVNRVGAMVNGALFDKISVVPSGSCCAT